VRIGEHEGTIVDISLFTTRLRTGRGAEITLPNALIVGSATRNYSRTVTGAGFMVDTSVTIGYDTPWRQVEAMLIEAAARTPGILTTAKPAGLPDRALRLTIRNTAWWPRPCLPEPYPRAEVVSRLHANIQDVFNEHGVQIMSPHYMSRPGQRQDRAAGKGGTHHPARQARGLIPVEYHPRLVRTPKPSSGASP
jgi:small-conductance mechanosensitive channel